MTSDYNKSISELHDETQSMLKEIRSSRGGFIEYKRHILHQLETHERAIESLTENIEQKLKEIESSQMNDTDQLTNEVRQLRQKTEENRIFYNQKIEELSNKNHNVHLIAKETATKISIGVSILVMILMFVVEKLNLFE